MIKIVDRSAVEKIRWDLDPDSYDVRLHKLEKDASEFIIVNPIYENWILDYIDTSISDRSCLMWVKGDKWIAKKFNKNWNPTHGWKVIECNFKVDRIGTYTIKEEFNEDLPKHLFDNLTTDIEPENYRLTHTWYLDTSYFKGDKVWVKKITACDNPAGTKDMGFVKPNIVDELDVVFLSYDEKNADENFEKVLNFAPYAQRVHGVKGIFEAHKAAAELAQTDMFYVVDADADLVPSWHFKFQPNIFNRDCVHVWKSRNPINDLEYGYGGIKLFPRHLLLEAKTWKVDMTTGLGRLKVIDKVSNVTAFNTDEFSTWRSAFRECAKLSAGIIKNQVEEENQQRLDTWLTKGIDRPFGKFAIAGAQAGKEYGETFKQDSSALQLINDRLWLRERFNEQIF